MARSLIVGKSVRHGGHSSARLRDVRSADLLRARGEVLLTASQENWHAAEASLISSLESARRQSALGWEPRSALVLSRWWKDRGRKGEARTLLADVYGRFTEGFDTAVCAKLHVGSANSERRLRTIDLVRLNFLRSAAQVCAAIRSTFVLSLAPGPLAERSAPSPARVGRERSPRR
jgi:hypothetical protein